MRRRGDQEQLAFEQDMEEHELRQEGLRAEAEAAHAAAAEATAEYNALEEEQDQANAATAVAAMLEGPGY